MDITEIKERKLNLEGEIRWMINNFQKETSTIVTDIRLDSYLVWEGNIQCQEIYKVALEVTIKS